MRKCFLWNILITFFPKQHTVTHTVVYFKGKIVLDLVVYAVALQFPKQTQIMFQHDNEKNSPHNIADVFFFFSEVENPAHSDFLKLRNMLVRTHMQDLKDVTQEAHYENYRSECIRNMTRMAVRERKRRSASNTQEVTYFQDKLPN